MPTTADGLRYPSLTDPANGPVAVQQLAEDVESKLATPRYYGLTRRLGTSANFTVNTNQDQTVTSHASGVVNRAARVDCVWYGFTLSGTSTARVLVRIWRNAAVTGVLLAQQYIDVPSVGGPTSGGAISIIDTAPGVSPTYVLTMHRPAGGSGTCELVGPTSGDAAVVMVQQLGTLY